MTRLDQVDLADGLEVPKSSTCVCMLFMLMVAQ